MRVMSSRKKDLPLNLSRDSGLFNELTALFLKTRRIILSLKFRLAPDFSAELPRCTELAGSRRDLLASVLIAVSITEFHLEANLNGNNFSLTPVEIKEEERKRDVSREETRGFYSDSPGPESDFLFLPLNLFFWSLIQERKGGFSERSLGQIIIP